MTMSDDVPLNVYSINESTGEVTDISNSCKREWETDPDTNHKSLVFKVTVDKEAKLPLFIFQFPSLNQEFAFDSNYGGTYFPIRTDLLGFKTLGPLFEGLIRCTHILVHNKEIIHERVILSRTIGTFKIPEKVILIDNPFMSDIESV